jgi:hypothetical protein
MAGGVATATAALATVGIEPLLGAGRPRAAAGAHAQVASRTRTPLGTHLPLRKAALRRRRRAAAALRRKRAEHWRRVPLELPLANDDELPYPPGWANFSRPTTI